MVNFYIYYFYINIVVICLFFLYVWGFKSCLAFYRVICKQEKATQSKDEEQSTLDFFDALSYNDLDKVHEEFLKEEADLETLKDQIKD